jgi:hypothetical protein
LISAQIAAPRLRSLAPWLGSIALGAAAGGAVGVAHRLGWLPGLWGGAGELASMLNRLVGPVWVPMLLIALRVTWLTTRALGTRFGYGALGEPVRPELGQLAPLFAALGLCGTVWGLTLAFDALSGDEFLTQLPDLLAGLGAAMTSTLVGLGLQITTLFLAAFNPAFSCVSVELERDAARFTLDGQVLGSDPLVLTEALRARQPEALLLRFDRRLREVERRAIRQSLWQRTDSAIPIREVAA